MNTFADDVLIQGNLIVIGNKPAYARTDLTQEDNARHKINPTDWRVHDAFQTNLTTAGATDDDLGLVGGTFGTGSPSIQAGDVKTVSKTRRARCTFSLPPQYVAGQSVTIRAHAGMLTTVADGSCTIDFEVYRSNDESSIGSDICATAATTINSLTFANKDFTITPSTLAAGDTLDIRMTIASVDTATGTAVTPCVGSVEVLIDQKG